MNKEELDNITLKALATQIMLTEQAIIKGECLIHAQLVTLRRQELREYKDVFNSLKEREMTEQERKDNVGLACKIMITDKDTETMAYAMGFSYGAHPKFTAKGAATPEGQPYLWKIYTDWLLDARCENATMERFKKGFLDGVLSLSINKEN